MIGVVNMAYDEILLSESKGLTEDMMKQVVNFIRYLKFSGETIQTAQFMGSRTKDPLAGGLISIADDFDQTPECFKEYV